MRKVQKREKGTERETNPTNNEWVKGRVKGEGRRSPTAKESTLGLLPPSFFHEGTKCLDFPVISSNSLTKCGDEVKFRRKFKI